MNEDVKLRTLSSGGVNRESSISCSSFATPWLLLIVLTYLYLPGITLAQALPAAEASPISTGFRLPVTAGTLTYGVSAAESLIFGYYGSSQNTSSSIVSGDLAFITNSKRDPFSLVGSGGYSWSSSSEPSYGFMSVAASQVLAIKRWSFVVSDSLNYLPSTPTTGIAGIAGLGDLGLSPIQIGPTDFSQGVLTNYSNRIDNLSSATVQRQVTGKTSFNANAAYGITRFLNNPVNPLDQGLNSDTVAGGGGINHQFNALNGLGAYYSYSRYTYVTNSLGLATPDFISQTASGVYSRAFNRRLSMSAAAGPEWTTIKLLNSSSSLSLFLDVNGVYTGKLSRASLAFIRSTNNGYGVIGGAISNSVNFVASRTYSRVWNAGVDASYSQSASLPLPGVTPTNFYTTLAGVQVSRAIGHSLSCYGNYTLENQATHGSVANVLDLFSGRQQVAAFGITYSPMPIHFGHP